jgi:hypothetical protein
MAHDVFISYAVEDKEVADKVCRALEEAGVRCWIAPRDVPVGADYEEAIVDAIAASPILILVLSPHSNASPHVKREIQNACLEGSGTEIIPFRIGEVPYNKALRYYLGSAQWLDASAPPLEQHLGPLVRQVRSHLRGPAGTLPPNTTEAAPLPERLRRAEPAHAPSKPLPFVWLAAGACVLLALVVAVVLVATRPSSGGGTNNIAANSNLATPVVNSNANQHATPTPQAATPTPSPRPLRTPIRPFPTNLNLRRH